MKAIVLTCDEWRTFTIHTILSYEQNWPNHPFEFVVPYNEEPLDGLKEMVESPIIGRKTSKPFRATVLTLLEDIDDGEWIYWLTDDQYLLGLDFSFGNYIYSILEEISTDGISFFRTRKLANGDALSDKKIVFKKLCLSERIDYSQIWLHQFLRGKVLRHLFKNMPEEVDNPKVMDKLKYEIGLPDDFELYVTQGNHGHLAESTRRGKITLNCLRSLQQYGLEVPSDFPVIERAINI